MPKYSLRELLYWWTVWIVGLSILTTVGTAPFALCVMTVWLIGTVLIHKAMDPWASFVYSTIVGVISVSVVGILFAGPMHESSDLYAVGLLFGLSSGSIVWTVVAAADSGYRWFDRRRAVKN